MARINTDIGRLASTATSGGADGTGERPDWIPTDKNTPPQPAPAPPPTPAEQLQALQLEQMREEAEYNAMMRPILLRQMGLTEVVDPDTGAKTLRQMTEEEKIAGMTDEEKSAYEIEQLVAGRQAKAARGELGIPQYVTDELKRQQTQQETALSQRLGAKGARISTPGINSRIGLLGNQAAAKNAYAYGQEQQGLGILGQSQNYLGNIANRNLGVYGGFPNAGLGVLGQAQTAMQPYTFGRQLQNEMESLSQQRTNAFTGGVMSGLGTVASMYLTKGMGGK